MVGQLVTGRFMDVVGTRMGFLLIMVFWSVSGILCSTARGIGSLSLFRFCLGLGEAGELAGLCKGDLGVVSGAAAWAGSRLLFGRRFGPGRDGCAGGDRAVDPVDGLALVVCDYRRTGFLVGAAVALVLPFAGSALADAERGTGGASKRAVRSGRGSARKQGIFAGWGTVLRYRQVWGVAAVRFFSDSILWFYLAWLPKYL